MAAASSLAYSAFAVKKTVSGSTTPTAVTLAGTPWISDATVTLTLASAVLSTDTVTVSYTKPNTGTYNKLADATGHEVASFTDDAVTNITPDTTPPSFSMRRPTARYSR